MFIDNFHLLEIYSQNVYLKKEINSLLNVFNTIIYSQMFMFLIYFSEISCFSHYSTCIRVLFPATLRKKSRDTLSSFFFSPNTYTHSAELMLALPFAAQNAGDAIYIYIYGHVPTPTFVHVPAPTCPMTFFFLITYFTHKKKIPRFTTTT